ncbi:unnamed protein product, partial [Tetraodon nigroviridis]
GYVSDRRYLGATVGRVANRIAKGRFVVDGVEYQLDVNNGPNALHGGLRGFSKALWRAQPVDAGVQLSLTSPDGDQGYPGEVQVWLTYTLQASRTTFAGGTLTAEYRAQASKTTPINLTNHSYFNLAGQGAADVYDHQVSIRAPWYLPVDQTSIPTEERLWPPCLDGADVGPAHLLAGEVRAVDGTVFDLREPVLLGPRLKELPEPGFDHNFCLCLSGDAWKERAAARVYHPASGRVLEVSTSQPGLQFYTGNHLDGSLLGKGGSAYGRHSSLCLETQNWPDAVNQVSRTAPPRPRPRSTLAPSVCVCVCVCVCSGLLPQLSAACWRPLPSCDPLQLHHSLRTPGGPSSFQSVTSWLLTGHQLASRLEPLVLPLFAGICLL